MKLKLPYWMQSAQKKYRDSYINKVYPLQIVFAAFGLACAYKGAYIPFVVSYAGIGLSIYQMRLYYNFKHSVNSKTKLDLHNRIVTLLTEHPMQGFDIKYLNRMLEDLRNGHYQSNSILITDLRLLEYKVHKNYIPDIEQIIKDVERGVYL